MLSRKNVLQSASLRKPYLKSEKGSSFVISRCNRPQVSLFVYKSQDVKGHSKCHEYECGIEHGHEGVDGCQGLLKDADVTVVVVVSLDLQVVHPKLSHKDIGDLANRFSVKSVEKV